MVLKEARLGEVLLERAHVLGGRPQEAHGLHVRDGVVARPDRHDGLAGRVRCLDVERLDEVDCTGGTASAEEEGARRCAGDGDAHPLLRGCRSCSGPSRRSFSAGHHEEEFSMLPERATSVFYERSPVRTVSLSKISAFAPLMALEASFGRSIFKM